MEANVEPSREIIPGEVIHITLQNVYWVVGIAYMFIMTVVAIHNIKK